MAEMFGADISRAHSKDAGDILSDKMREFLEKVGVPNGLRAFGYNSKDLNELVEGTLPQVHKIV